MELDALTAGDTFERRHLGPRDAEVTAMLSALGLSSLDSLMEKALPEAIRTRRPLDLPAPLSEREALSALAERAGENQVWRSYLGLGYYNTVTPPVLLRNILENPGWYTAYTPYQAEISQGRLEALLMYQTMVEDLTGMEVANASLLDEATAAAEAMAMSHRITRGKVSDVYFVSEHCHPQTIAVVKTRARPLGIDVVVGDHRRFDFSETRVFGALVQYPATDGVVFDYADFVEAAHGHKAIVTVATDLLALTQLRAPGAFGADIAIGNSQRFGVPLGYGGPHAAFLSTRASHRRLMPGRVIGVSRDADGNPALRMALQTREQHIRRQKATSNICTAQVLLAVVAGMYAAWHGPAGLDAIGRRVHALTNVLASGLVQAGHKVHEGPWFDTIRVTVTDPSAVRERAEAHQINLRWFSDGSIGISLDETVGASDLLDLLDVFGAPTDGLSEESTLPEACRRQAPFCTHPSFSKYHSETEMLRFLHRLESRDLALNTSMIPLGSCTMKLNATTEMIPVTWAGFGAIHPFVPTAQAAGYGRLFSELEAWLGEVTGFDGVSLQPNAGSQGEYAGLLCIRAYHEANGESRNVCLIPQSAHGTNPASAVMAGMKVVPVSCDDQGNIDVEDLKAKAEKHGDALAALMVTYPSTHGVFEEAIRDICEIVHGHGGQVYMDGANMNAMVGLSRPAELGADVLHLNLHKTFCIPHGGGGPGMGPIGVRAHLQPYLPGHPLVDGVGDGDPVSAAPWGSPSILPISWAYIAMLGGEGLTRASKIAILNANYVAKRLEGHFDVLYTGAHGFVAHECILDLRGFKDSAGIQVDDVAKRLMDYGFHAPTMSWPVAGTLMVEPTESESQEELDRFCDAMIAIRQEIRAVEEGSADPEDNALKNAPHTAASVIADTWTHAYSREHAAYPAPWLREHKYWPFVRRIDNAWGDRNLMCSCIVEWPPAES